MIVGEFKLELGEDVTALMAVFVTVVVAGLGVELFLLKVPPTPPPTAAPTATTAMSAARRKKFDLLKPYSRSSFLFQVPWPAMSCLPKIFPSFWFEASAWSSGCSTSSLDVL